MCTVLCVDAATEKFKEDLASEGFKWRPTTKIYYANEMHVVENKNTSVHIPQIGCCHR